MQKCNDLHPTLFWHDLYDDYLDKEECVVRIKDIAKRFGQMITDEEALESYYENLRIKELEYSDESGECSVCKTATHYMHMKTKKFVCSDKCKYEAE